MNTAKQREQEEALAHLREIVRPGDRIYGIVRSVSKSGMSRVISFYKLTAEGPLYLTGWIGKAIGYRRVDGWRDGLRVNGCGMDMIFAVVYELGRVIFPNGGPRITGSTRYNQDMRAAKERRERAPLPAATWEPDGGYLLRHDQL